MKTGFMPRVMSDEAMAQLGAPRIVYIRQIRFADIREEIDASDAGAMMRMPDDATLYAVHAADGTRMAVLDSRDMAFITARQNEMEPVSVH
jgi:hypothetical protein